MAALNYHARPAATQDAFCLTDIEQIRRENPLPAIAGSTIKLRKVGSEWIGLCPFHSERTPSFTIYEGGQRFKCFGCNATGDVLDFIQAMHGIDFVGALNLLGAGNLPRATFKPAPSDVDRQDRRDEALTIWNNATEATGTPAESYLRTRRITMALPPTLRFARLPYGGGGILFPVLVALVQLPDGQPIGIQRTYLNAAGTGKAAVPKPKLSLGSIRGGSIHLGVAGSVMTVCEGLEDGLTLAQELGGCVWVGAGTSGMIAMQLPACVKSIIIGADADDAGNKAAREVGQRFADAGLGVRIIRPLDGFKDFNAELLGALV